VIRSIRATGYDEFSLASLNTGEYGAIHPLLFDLMDRFEPESVSVSLSSMHASTMTQELAEQVRRVRKSGFTIAPEAGTQRLRNVINKNLDEAQILNACRLAFEAGWDVIKLYFMIGLPTETDADVDGLVDLAHEILATGRRAAKGRRPEITLSASSFVPKAVTPFQWLGQDRMENLYRKQDRIAARVRRGVRFKHHECETTFLEAVFSRGDRRLSRVIERAWRNGARFDGWFEHFKNDVWVDALRAEGIDPDFYAYGDWDTSWPLPWDVVDSLVNKKWLAIDLKRALREGTLEVCGPKECHGCAPFAKDCVKGVVSVTTGRPLDHGLAVLSTPAAELPGCAPRAPEPPPPLLPKEREEIQAGDGNELRYRYRARFTKTGKVRYLGHLDLSRTLMRAFRRARLPLAYSQGFNPKPRVAFGPALPLGVASEGEYVDLELQTLLEPEETLATLNRQLPPGIRFDSMREIGRSVPALSEAIRSARYRIHTGEGLALEDELRTFRARGSVEILRERKGKRSVLKLDDALLGIEPVASDTLRMTLALGGEGASVRPDEVLSEVFGERAAGMKVVREELFVDWEGRRVDPLLAASAAESHAGRAPRP
jgi:radical SAM-linked protein